MVFIEDEYSPVLNDHSYLSSQDSDASIPLSTKLFKQPPQRPAGESVSLPTEGLVHPASHSPSSTPAGTSADPTTIPVSTTPSPSSADNNDNDSTTESFVSTGPKPLQRVKYAKKPQEYFRPSPTLPGASPKPFVSSQKKVPAKRRIAFLDTEQSLELAKQNEGPKIKKARTKSPETPATEPSPLREPENWVAAIEADANNAQESAHIPLEQPHELVLPPLELPLDDELPVEVPLSRPPLAIKPPIWAEVRVERGIDFISL